HLECRRDVNGDEGLYPQSPGIPEEGLLVTSVHEGAGPSFMHVVRPTFPPGFPTFVALKPGDTFTDAQRSLFVRPDGYLVSGVDALCGVEVDYLSPPFNGSLLFWDALVTPGKVSGFGSYDIGWNHPLPPGGPGSGGSGSTEALAHEPLWPGHNNVLFVRAHTDGTLPVSHAKVDVSLQQPARFSSECGSDRIRDVRRVVLGPVDPVD